jgi:hypothetical protein
MTPDDLRSRLATLHPAVRLPPLEDLGRLLATLEAKADENPADRDLAAAVREVHAMARASVELPPIIGGVRREQLVRWDEWSTTWDGVGAVSGRSCRIRVLRPESARDPVYRRMLSREGRALRLGGWHIEVIDGDLPAMVVPVDGPTLHAHPVGASPDDAPSRLVRLFGSTLRRLERLEAAGLGLADLDPSEIRLGPDGVQFVCLTPGGPADLGRVLGEVCRGLLAYWSDGPETPIDDLLAGFARFPPADLAEARDALLAALAQHLAGHRHDLQRRAERSHRAERRARLLDVVLRLERAVPCPIGRGAVGVDLEGATTVIESDGHRLTWGPSGKPEVAWSDGDGVVPGITRRLLRARAASPLNPRLQLEIDGDAAFVDAACRWLAARLAHRTTRLLLESDA